MELNRNKRIYADMELMIEEFKKKHPANINDYIHARTYSFDTLHELSKEDDANKKYRIRNWPSIECPFFTDEEIDSLEGYYSDTVNHESYHDYFDENGIQAMNRERDNTSNKTYGQRVRQLQLQVQNAATQEEADEYRQQLVDLGWNPEIDYNEQTQIMAKERFTRLTYHEDNFELIDLKPVIEFLSDDSVVTEATAKPNKHAISVVLVRGASAIAPIIAKVTNSPYSHAGLVFDGDFDHIFSFSQITAAKRFGGFALEKIADYPKDNNMAVYTLFVNEEDYKKMHAGAVAMANIKDQTTFNVFNLVFFPFRHIYINSSKSLICSQFVETILRLGNIEFFNGVPAAKVSPDMLYRTMKSNAKVYDTYSDVVKNFNGAKIKKALDKLCKNAKLFKEGAIAFVAEALEIQWFKFPVEKNSEGDILITNPRPNMEQEYSSSHKLLLEYDKAHNYEAMKYELARLFYMNYLLEKRLYHSKFVVNKEKNIKLRARVLNDFKKYIRVVLKNDPTFNFDTYYQTTPFYPHTVVVDKTVGEILKDLLGTLK